MFIKKMNTVAEMVAGDHTLLKEVLHPDHDAVSIGYSVAHARLRPHTASQLHALTSSELYVILQGQGTMHIDEETQAVEANDLIFIPPKANQFIANTGSEDLCFLCIVEPYWRREDEVILD